MKGTVVKLKEEAEQLKSTLVKEICSISSRTFACNHQGKSDFIDWYLLLRVEETAGIDAIKKRYHQLALQIHPDKNKHLNAEVAFKLVSEAYACLSNKTRREEFDRERTERICNQCKRTSLSYVTRSSLYKESKTKVNEKHISTRKGRTVEQVKGEMKEALKEEAKVIANSIEICNQTPRKESPVFDPSMYKSPTYPHPRTRLPFQNEFYTPTKQNTVRNCHDRREKVDFPVYENRSRNSCIFPSRTKHRILRL